MERAPRSCETFGTGRDLQGNCNEDRCKYDDRHARCQVSRERRRRLSKSPECTSASPARLEQWCEASCRDVRPAKRGATSIGVAEVSGEGEEPIDAAPRLIPPHVVRGGAFLCHNQCMHEVFMRRCLQLAEQGRGQTGINPMVGAVLVRDEKIIAEGFHREFGKAHAAEQAWIRNRP